MNGCWRDLDKRAGPQADELCPPPQHLADDRELVEPTGGAHLWSAGFDLAALRWR